MASADFYTIPPDFATRYFYINNHDGSINSVSSEQNRALVKLDSGENKANLVRFRSTQLLRSLPDGPMTQGTMSQLYINIGGEWFHLFKIEDNYPSQPIDTGSGGSKQKTRRNRSRRR